MEDFGKITWEMEEGAVDANTNRVHIKGGGGGEFYILRPPVKLNYEDIRYKSLKIESLVSNSAVRKLVTERFITQFLVCL